MAVFAIPVTKGGGTVEVDLDKIPPEAYEEVVRQGLKVLLNRGMSKVTKADMPDEAERKESAMAIATKQLELVYTNKIKFSGEAKVKKASGAVMTEAMRVARNMVKDWMKANKIKLNSVEKTEITEAAKAIIANDPSILETAAANLEERAKKPVAIDLSTMVKESPELVAKAKAKAKKDKADSPLSATQAGQVATRKKGDKPQAQATH